MPPPVILWPEFLSSSNASSEGLDPRLPVNGIECWWQKKTDVATFAPVHEKQMWLLATFQDGSAERSSAERSMEGLVRQASQSARSAGLKPHTRISTMLRDWVLVVGMLMSAAIICAEGYSAFVLTSDACPKTQMWHTGSFFVDALQCFCSLTIAVYTCICMADAHACTPDYTWPYVCMPTLMSIHIFAQTCVHISLLVHMHMSMPTSKHMSVHVSAHTFVHMFRDTCLSTCLPKCLYACL